jgi:hypothetical protein
MGRNQWPQGTAILALGSIYPALSMTWMTVMPSGRRWPAEAQAILDAIRRGDRSRVMTVEELFREMDALGDAEEPGA